MNKIKILTGWVGKDFLEEFVKYTDDEIVPSTPQYWFYMLRKQWFEDDIKVKITIEKV